MARVYTYILIMTGMMILLELGGIQTGLNALLVLIGISITGLGTTSANITTSTLSDVLFSSSSGLLIAGIATGAIIAGLFTRSSPENFILLPLITGIGFAFAGTFVSVINYAVTNGSVLTGSIAVLIMAPMAVGYVISLAEFFRGTA